MSTTVEERGTLPCTRTDSDHIYCECSPDVTLCGLPADEMEETDRQPTCVVCADLDEYVCERCET